MRYQYDEKSKDRSNGDDKCEPTKQRNHDVKNSIQYNDRVLTIVISSFQLFRHFDFHPHYLDFESPAYNKLTSGIAI